jgi:hypothetical protein
MFLLCRNIQMDNSNNGRTDMRAQFTTVIYCVVSFAVVLTFSGPVSAQGMGMSGPAVPAAAKPIIKVLDENEKVRVIDEVRRPGEISPMNTHPMRVLYVIRGGIIERTFADGTKENHALKTGQTEILTETRPYSVNNVGKTTIHIVEVALK